MSKSSMLQSIIATIILTSIKKTLDIAFKNIKQLEATTMHKNLIQVTLKVREIATKKI